MTQTDIDFPRPGHYVSANGLDIYYEEDGKGEPLILLHGGTGTSQMWQPHLPFFAQHFKVYAPDSRGHGRTNNPAGEYSYRMMADDVAAFIQALGSKRPLIFGYSLGGQITLEIGMHYSNLTKVLVVGAASYKFSDFYFNSIKAIFGLEAPGVVNIDQIERVNPDLIEFWKSVHSWADDADYWQTLLRQISKMWLTPLDYTAADLQKITEPTLLLLGDRDEIIPLEETVEI